MKKIKENKIFKIVKNILKVLITIFILIIVGVILIQRIFNNNFSLAGFRIYTVATGSMVPEYNVLDIIITKTKDMNEIKIGDDVVYLGKEGDFYNKIVTHRVIGKQETDGKTYFRTKGIANRSEDPLIDETQIYGVVLKKSFILSFISKLVNSNVGFYLLILIPGAILITLEIIDKVNKKDETSL